MIFAKFCLVWQILYTARPVLILHLWICFTVLFDWFPFPLDHLQCFKHCVNWHPVYYNTTFPSQCRFHCIIKVMTSKNSLYANSLCYISVSLYIIKTLHNPNISLQMLLLHAHKFSHFTCYLTYLHVHELPLTTADWLTTGLGGGSWTGWGEGGHSKRVNTGLWGWGREKRVGRG